MLTHELVVGAMRQARENERLSPEGVADLQQRKLRELLAFAKAKSPFYGRLYQGIDVEHAPLTDLPRLNKETVQQHFDGIVTDPRLNLAGVKAFCNQPAAPSSPWYQDAFAVLMSSGTTGLRGYYVWDAATLADAIAVGVRQSARGAAAPTPTLPHPRGEGGEGGGAANRLAAVMQIETSDATNILLNMIPPTAATTRLIDIRQPFAAVLDQLNKFQPTSLSSYPYMLWVLSEAQKKKRIQLKLERLTSSADVLTDRDRAAIEGAFGAPIYNYYCSTEAPYIAWECDAHDGLHVNSDYLVLESVDADYRPVPDGTLGEKILLTNLSNRAMPLVRYEMSDQVEYETVPCSCGCPLPRIRSVAGRIEHILTLPGYQDYPVRLVEEHVDDLVGRLERVAKYQVIQEDAGRLTVNVIPRNAAEWEAVRTAVSDALATCFQRYGVNGDAVRIDMHQVAELEPIKPGGGKVCRFWNRWKG